MLIIESVTSNSTRLSPFDVSMASCLSVIWQMSASRLAFASDHLPWNEYPNGPENTVSASQGEGLHAAKSWIHVDRTNGDDGHSGNRVEYCRAGIRQPYPPESRADPGGAATQCAQLGAKRVGQAREAGQGQGLQKR